MCEVNATTHQGVRRQFGQHLIRPGLIENEWSSVLSEGLDERLSADYDAEVVFNQAQAQREVQQAKRFLERMKSYLLENGIEESEIEES
jgi:uncharacterized protein (UPF0332 family)